MPGKPRTAADLIPALSARSEWLGKSAGLLQRACAEIAEALALPHGSTLFDLIRWADDRNERLRAAQANLRKAERLLGDDLTSVRQAAALIEGALGMRRMPGRPAVVTEVEIRLARFGREDGKSWEQIRRILNRARLARRLPPLSLTTLRSALKRHPPVRRTRA